MTRPSIAVGMTRTVASPVPRSHASSTSAVARRTTVGIFAAMIVAMTFSGCGASGNRASDGPIYLVNNTTAVQFAEGSTLDWNLDDDIVVSAVPVPNPPTDQVRLTLPAPTDGALEFAPFMAPKGSERNKGAWKLSGESWMLNGKGALLPSVCPRCLMNGNQAAVKSAGGTYSMGIAYMKGDHQTVVSAYYTTIEVEAGTGKWKFETPH